GLDFTSEYSLRDLTYQTDERQLYALLSPQAHALFPGFLPVVPLLNPDGTPNISTTSLVGGLFVLNPDHHETFGNDVSVRSAEIVTSYEVGLKGTTGSQKLAYDLSVYYYDYSNFQAQVLDPTVGPIAIEVNGGRAHALGFEASLYARLSARTTGFMNISLSDG